MLDRLDALEKAATPGPWTIQSDGYATCPVGSIAVDYSISYPEEGTAEDLDFLVAARNALPALIAVARAADEWVDYQVTERHGRWLDGIPGDLLDALEGLKGQGDE